MTLDYTLIGLAAATLTTISFVPQAWQVIKTKDTKAISLLGYISFTTGIGLWLVYGLILKDIPLIIANIITFILVLIILVLKIKHG